MKKQLKKNPWFASSMVVIVCLLIFMGIFYFTDTKIEDVINTIEQAGFFSLLVVLAMMFGQLILQAISWQILLKGTGYCVNFTTICYSIFAGWAANFVTPSMYLGGEPVRAYLLSKGYPISFSNALGSVLVHKFLEFAAFMILILISVFSVFIKFYDSLSFHVKLAILLAVFLMMIVLAGIVCGIAFQKRFFSWMARIIAKAGIVRSFFTTHSSKIKDLDDVILDSFFKYPIATLFSLMGMILFEFLIFLRPLLFFIFLDRTLSFGELAFIFLLIQLIQALQFTPGGVGLLEGGTVGIMSIIGISPAYALCFATFCRLGDIAIVSLGFSLGIYSTMKDSQLAHD